MNLLLLGVNHHTASLDDREALAFGPDATFDLLARLGRRGVLARGGAALDVQPHRVLRGRRATPRRPSSRCATRCSALRRRDLLGPGPHRYLLAGAGVVARTCSAWRAASTRWCSATCRSSGRSRTPTRWRARRARRARWLDRLFETALHAGKRSRAETSIGAGTVSMASAAVELAVQVMTGLARPPRRRRRRGRHGPAGRAARGRARRRRASPS